MKHKIWYQHLISALFAFVLSVSAIGNLITGYALPVDSLWKICLFCAVFSLVSSVLFRFRYGGRIIICMAALACWRLWLKEESWLRMQEQVQYLCYIISSHYHYVYDWPILGIPANSDVTYPLLLWAALVAVSVNFYMCRRKHIAIAIIPAIVPLVLCLVTTDRVPDTVYLYLLILGLAILLLTDWTRRKQPAQGVKLILRCLLPVAASVALIFAWNPREEYVNNVGKFQKEVVQWFLEFQNKAESVLHGTPMPSVDGEMLNLRTVGPKNTVSYSVMRVRSPIAGKLYLRGQDYGEYTGTGWTASFERREAFTSGRASLGKLTIVTYGVRNIRYVPYYATEEIPLIGGALPNEENLQRYSYYLSRKYYANAQNPSSQYTMLPEDTLTWARKLAADITGGISTDEEKILRIQNYVCNSATYDLSTTRMDPEYSDFAQWFLEESDTGYCVHFATAATVLLRAAGIPARYVEGYLASCTADLDVVVTNQEAHAWAEYYNGDTGGWCVLEATPAAPEDDAADPTSTMPITITPEQTQPGVEDTATAPDEAETIPATHNHSQEAVLGVSDDSPQNSGLQDQGKVHANLPAWISTVFECLLLAACVPIQGHLRILWKRMLWNQAGANARTMARWRQTRSLAKWLKQSYPEALDILAQKAKFSQHRIQPEELQQFEDYRISLLEPVKKKVWYQRVLIQWILAVE